MEGRAEITGRLIESLDPSQDDDVEATRAEEIRRRIECLDSEQARTVRRATSMARSGNGAGRNTSPAR